MAETLRGGVTVSGLKPGRTTLTIQAGDITKTIPVTVLPSLFPELTPGTNAGITLTETTPGTYHVNGTSTGYAVFAKTIHLDTGTYKLLGDVWGGKVYAQLTSTAGQNVLGAGADPTSTLPAGDYTAKVGVRPNNTVEDLVITPILTKTN